IDHIEVAGASAKGDFSVCSRADKCGGPSNHQWIVWKIELRKVGTCICHADIRFSGCITKTVLYYQAHCYSACSCFFDSLLRALSNSEVSASNLRDNTSGADFLASSASKRAVNAVSAALMMSSDFNTVALNSFSSCKAFDFAIIVN